MADWIIGFMPPHMGYVEPFFGSGAVFFNKEPSKLEIINDLDGEVVQFFRVLRSRPQELARAIALTPWARDEFDYCRLSEPVADDLEMARRFQVKMSMAIGSGTDEQTGWKHHGKALGGSCAHAWIGMPEKIIMASQRILCAQIENRPAVEIIQAMNTPEILIYADPPYVTSTRTANRDQYRHEMTDADHEALLTALNQHSGMALLSGYDCPMYRDMLKDWRIESITTRAERAATRTECLWINPIADEKGAQTNLFDMEVHTNGKAPNLYPEDHLPGASEA